MMQAPVVIVNARNEVLAHRNRHSTKLPTVYLPTDLGGLSLATALHKQFGLKVFWLLRSDGSRFALPLLRLQSEEPSLPLGHAWVQPCDLTHGPMPEQNMLDRLNSVDESWGQYSWYQHVQDWLAQTLSQLGHNLKALDQWNSRAGNVLIRVATDGPHFWFKAVGDKNWRDFAVSQVLRQLHPLDRPRILAIETSWKAMLLEHVQGICLAECTNQRTSKRAARMLADIQKRYAEQSEVFVRAGATDLRASTLLQKAPAYLRSLEDAITRQTTVESYSGQMPSIQISEVEEMSPHLLALCAEVASLPYSDGLFNADFDPQRILFTSKGIVLIDWAQACVSWPLAASRYLWLRLMNRSLEHVSRCTLLSMAHWERWEKITGRTPIFRGASLADAFSVIAAAVLYCEQTADHLPDDRILISFGIQLRWAICSTLEDT